MSEELAHHGVKGMHWGVRRYDKERAERGKQFAKRAKANKDNAPTKVETWQKPGGYIQTAGGRGQLASQDAVIARKHAQKAKASTTDSLSNQELQTLVTRMNLEQQYANLTAQQDRRSKGTKAVHKILGMKSPIAAGSHVNEGSVLADVAVSALPHGKTIGAAMKVASAVSKGPQKKK